MTDIQALRHSRLCSNLPLWPPGEVLGKKFCSDHCSSLCKLPPGHSAPTATISDYINYEGYYRYLDIHYNTFNESLYFVLDIENLINFASTLLVAPISNIKKYQYQYQNARNQGGPKHSEDTQENNVQLHLDYYLTIIHSFTFMCCR